MTSTYQHDHDDHVTHRQPLATFALDIHVNIMGEDDQLVLVPDYLANYRLVSSSYKHSYSQYLLMYPSILKSLKNLYATISPTSHLELLTIKIYFYCEWKTNSLLSHITIN